MKMTAFGNLLTSYQKEKKLAIEVAKQALNKRSPRDPKFDYELKEITIQTHDGGTVHSIELWQKIDEEHIKLNGHVSVQVLEKKQMKDELKELLS